MSRTKEVELAAKLMFAINEVLTDEDNDNHIKLDNDNLTDFFYALGGLMPAMIYSSVTGVENNALEFNHIVNHLCFQYGKKED